mgnify:CR=1 FL=1
MAGLSSLRYFRLRGMHKQERLLARGCAIFCGHTYTHAYMHTAQVLIFCESKQDVDDIHEYLMLKGVAAVGIHGGKDQEEREYAINSFREQKKDVLIGTDIASKGLDFPDIQHVINFDMPKEIENYVHRIGRTGRCGKTGVATTFINAVEDEESTLRDLVGLLQEAEQRLAAYTEESRAALESRRANLSAAPSCTISKDRVPSVSTTFDDMLAADLTCRDATPEAPA